MPPRRLTISSSSTSSKATRPSSLLWKTFQSFFRMANTQDTVDKVWDGLQDFVGERGGIAIPSAFHVLHSLHHLNSLKDKTVVTVFHGKESGSFASHEYVEFLVITVGQPELVTVIRCDRLGFESEGGRREEDIATSLKLHSDSSTSLKFSNKFGGADLVPNLLRSLRENRSPAVAQDVELSDLRYVAHTLTTCTSEIQTSRTAVTPSRSQHLTIVLPRQVPQWHQHLAPARASPSQATHPARNQHPIYLCPGSPSRVSV